MKKIKYFIIIILLFIFNLYITSCSVNNHEHEYNSMYIIDEDYHWLECSCGKIKSKSKHTYGQWIIIDEASDSVEGLKKKKCSVCENEVFEIIPKLDHIHEIVDGVCTKCNELVYSEGLLYNLKADNTYEVVGLGTCSNEYLIIPRTYKEKDITSIKSEAFKDELNIKTLIISDNIINIGENSFIGCNNLVKVVLPFVGYALYGNIKTFGYIFGGNSNIPASLEDVCITGDDRIYIDAFSGCCNIKTIEFSSSIKRISSGAFSNCDNLDNIYYNGTFDDWCDIVFVEPTSNPMSYADNLYFLDDNGNYLRKYNKYSMIDELNITKDINDYQFIGFSNITNINFSSDITSIGKGAFWGCSSLTEIYLPFGLTTIYEDAFISCINLETIYIPNTIKELKEDIFRGCNKINKIFFDGSVEQWNNYNCVFEGVIVYYYNIDEPTNDGYYWYYDSENNIVIW